MTTRTVCMLFFSSGLLVKCLGIQGLRTTACCSHMTTFASVLVGSLVIGRATGAHVAVHFDVLYTERALYIEATHASHLGTIACSTTTPLVLALVGCSSRNSPQLVLRIPSFLFHIAYNKRPVMEVTAISTDFGARIRVCGTCTRRLCPSLTDTIVIFNQ